MPMRIMMLRDERPNEIMINSKTLQHNNKITVLQVECFGDKDEVDYLVEKLKQRANGKGFNIEIAIV